MDSGNSPFDYQPPLFAADFAIIVLFDMCSFQLLLVFLLTGIKTRKPWSGAFGVAAEQEAGLLRFHRARFAILMAISLISPIIVYSAQAASMLPTSIDTSTFYSILTTYVAFLEIRNVFFSAVLIAVLDSGIKVSQLRPYSSTAISMQVGTNVNIIAMSCLVALLVIFAIARIAVYGQLEADVFANDPSAVQQWSAQFGLAQTRISINAILAIYYTAVAIFMQRKKHMVPHEPGEVDQSYSFRVLDRIVILVCPLLLFLTLYTIISDAIVNTIVPTTPVTPDDILTSLSFYFADDFISGVMIIMLNIAAISVGYVL